MTPAERARARGWVREWGSSDPYWWDPRSSDRSKVRAYRSEWDRWWRSCDRDGAIWSANSEDDALIAALAAYPEEK